MRSNDEIIDIIISEKEKKGFSLSELARRTDIAKSAMSRYLNKTRMFPLNRAQDFANALDISVDYLLGYNEEQMNEQLSNLITDLEEKLTQYREQYDVMKEILSERLQYLDQVLHEDEIHRGKAITTLHTIKALVDSSEEMFDLILSIKENHFKSEKLRLIIQSINQTNELNELIEKKDKNNESLQKLDSSESQ